MHISIVALDRMAQKSAANDPDYAALLKKNGKFLRSDGYVQSDDQLLGSLSRLVAVHDRHQFTEVSKRFLSAQAMSRALLANAETPVTANEDDWVWIACAVLWERWIPERPSLEMIDDWMQAGYRALDQKKQIEACELWLRTWNAILGVLESRHIRTIDAFDNLVGGTQSLFNWIQDLSDELYNGGLDDRRFWNDRVAVCEAILHRLDLEQTFNLMFRRDLAETHLLLGHRETGDTLFQRLVAEYPQYSWGWIGWSDIYWLRKGSFRDFAKAESILKQGLAVPDVQERHYLLDRLADLYQRSDRGPEAETIRAEIKRLEEAQKQSKSGVSLGKAPCSIQFRRMVDIPEGSLPLEQLERIVKEYQDKQKSAEPRKEAKAGRKEAKVGRNDPCPCGSGKKFKRCCGGRI